LVGWVGRPEDLLSDGKVGPKAPPALWLAPGWKDIDQRPSAEEQYRFALLGAPKDAQVTAWLAVPGYFPQSREWISRALTQLARELLRRNDSERLQSLAAEVERWEGGQAHEKRLAKICRAGVDALNRDLQGVYDDFAGPIAPKELTDPALLELSLEVIAQAERIAALTGASESYARSKLRPIHQDLLVKLFQSEQRDPSILPPIRPGG
jgi:serine/threonine-protein kinase